MDYGRSPNCECNPNIECTHISNSLAVRQCNEKCDFEWGDKIFPAFFFFGSCNIFNLIGSFGASIMSLQQHFWLNFMIMALFCAANVFFFLLASANPSSPVKILPVYTQNRKIRIQRFEESACAWNLHRTVFQRNHCLVYTEMLLVSKCSRVTSNDISQLKFSFGWEEQRRTAENRINKSEKRCGGAHQRCMK